MSDNVNHPAHYTQGCVECIDAIEAAVTGLQGIEAVCTGNAIKYLWRWKQKNGVEDLRKVRWYIDRLIEEKEMTENVIEKAIEKWGKEAQTIVAMEECAELIKECSKMLRGQGNIDHLIEEIADVLICLEELEIIYDIDNGDVLTEQIFKLEKLEKRLEEEK